MPSSSVVLKRGSTPQPVAFRYLAVAFFAPAVSLISCGFEATNFVALIGPVNAAGPGAPGGSEHSHEQGRRRLLPPGVGYDSVEQGDTPVGYRGDYSAAASRSGTGAVIAHPSAPAATSVPWPAAISRSNMAALQLEQAGQYLESAITGLANMGDPAQRAALSPHQASNQVLLPPYLHAQPIVQEQHQTHQMTHGPRASRGEPSSAEHERRWRELPATIRDIQRGVEAMVQERRALPSNQRGGFQTGQAVPQSGHPQHQISAPGARTGAAPLSSPLPHTVEPQQQDEPDAQRPLYAPGQPQLSSDHEDLTRHRQWLQAVADAAATHFQTQERLARAVRAQEHGHADGAPSEAGSTRASTTASASVAHVQDRRRPGVSSSGRAHVLFTEYLKHWIAEEANFPKAEFPELYVKAVHAADQASADAQTCWNIQRKEQEIVASLTQLILHNDQDKNIKSRPAPQQAFAAPKQGLCSKKTGNVGMLDGVKTKTCQICCDEENSGRFTFRLVHEERREQGRPESGTSSQTAAPIMDEGCSKTKMPATSGGPGGACCDGALCARCVGKTLAGEYYLFDGVRDRTYHHGAHCPFCNVPARTSRESESLRPTQVTFLKPREQLSKACLRHFENMQDAASASRAPSAERRSILATQGRGKGKNGTKGQHDAKGQGKRGSGRTNKSRPVDAILPFDVDTKSSLSRLHGDAENDYIVENYWIRVDDTTQLLDSKMRARDVTMAELRKQISALELRLWNTATEEDRSKAKAGEQPAGKARNYAAIMDYSRLSGLAKLDLVLALAQWDN